jgi:hypothetical protein
MQSIASVGIGDYLPTINHFGGGSKMTTGLLTLPSRAREPAENPFDGKQFFRL